MSKVWQTFLPRPGTEWLNTRIWNAGVVAGIQNTTGTTLHPGHANLAPIVNVVHLERCSTQRLTVVAWTETLFVVPVGRALHIAAAARDLRARRTPRNVLNSVGDTGSLNIRGAQSRCGNKIVGWS